MRIGMRHGLIGLFGGGVERQREIGALALEEGHVLIAAIDGAGGGHQQMADGVEAGDLQHIEAADEIGVDIGARILEAVANARLRGEMDDDLGLGRLRRARQRRHILEHGDMGAKTVEARQLGVARLFQSARRNRGSCRRSRRPDGRARAGALRGGSR